MTITKTHRHDTEEHCTICGDNDCHLDIDGWCEAHGWNCAEFHLFLEAERERTA